MIRAWAHTMPYVENNFMVVEPEAQRKVASQMGGVKRLNVETLCQKLGPIPSGSNKAPLGVVHFSPQAEGRTYPKRHYIIKSLRAGPAPQIVYQRCRWKEPTNNRRAPEVTINVGQSPVVKSDSTSS